MKNKRIANYCVSKIRKEAGENVLSTPGKKKPRAEEYKFHYDDFNRTVIRNLFIEFYQVKKIVPTAPKLLKEIRLSMGSRYVKKVATFHVI